MTIKLSDDGDFISRVAFNRPFQEGDLFEYIFYVPAPEFLKLTENKNNKTDKRVFTVGLNNPDKSKYAEFMIEKRELANKIIEIMDKL